ncbi:hypothetical protein BDV10DRAFT_188478 [Aspergillus recurvatus]
MADILGAIAASDQLIGSFSSACRQLRKAYKIMKYAESDIRQVKKRTETIRDLWRFFKQTMKDVFQIVEFSVDLEEYQQFYQDLNKQAQKLADKIFDVLRILSPILKRETVSKWIKLQIRWAWFVQEREALRLLYEEMGLLAGFMAFFMNLVQLQIAAKQYMLQKSAATKVQVDGLERTLSVQLEEIKRIVKSHGPTPGLINNKEKADLLKEIRRVMREEVRRIPRPGAADNSTSDTSPPSSPPPEPSSTPPTDPDNRDNSKGISEFPDKELNPKSEQPILPLPSPAIPPRPHPVNFFPGSEVSYVTICEASPKDPPTAADFSPVPIQLQARTDGGSESPSISGDMYMPTALFGPPKKQRRPRPGRVSNDTLTQTSSRGDPRDKKAIDHKQRRYPENTVLGSSHGPPSRNDEGAPQDQNGSRLTSRGHGAGTRGRTTRQQTYGADGLVLPSHIIPTPENVEAWLRTQ